MSLRAARAIAFTIATGLVVITGCGGGDSVEPLPSVRAVTVSSTGTGSGTVISSPAGINCGSACSASLTATAPITLTAAPAANSQFAGWSGACTGASTACSVPAGTSAVAATARFDLVTYTLTAALAGVGTGSVTSAPAGITCGTDCTEAYASGTTVTLTAAPAVGSTFLGWSGSGCAGTGTCVVTMTQAASVTATFTLTINTLTVTRAGTGTGSVTSAPAGINCGADCTEGYAFGTSVTLTAAAAVGSTFEGWSGACTGTTTCVVAMNAAQTVTATFTLTVNTLTVTRAGTGTGSVSSAPTGINCGADCTEGYAFGTSVTLTAAAAAGSTFAGWSGACTGAGTCVVAMNAAQTVTATFTLASFTLTITPGGTGTGAVTSTPAGISCGADCSEPYTLGTVVTLTAAANAGSGFTGWSGACTGVGACVVTMNAATSVTATFDVIATGPTWPDSWTRFCTDLTAAVACPGGPAGQDGHYVINPPNYAADAVRVVDPTTGLVWERNPPLTNISHAAAIGYCENLVLAGFDDWRVPSYLEMVSLTDFGRVGPPFASTPFPGIPQNSWYWLSTDRTATPAQAYAINTNYPVTGFRTKTETDGSIVRCVRGTGFSGAFTVAGGSVTDSRTGLVWQSATASTDMTWVNALAYCEALVLDTRSDWRLPSGKELLSLVDPTLVNPSISPLFSSRPATVFWTSSALSNFPTDAYAINFNFGASDGISTPMTALRSVRCVR